MGTRDVDLCLSVAIIERRVGSYEKIEASLRDLGYSIARDEDGTPQTWRWQGGVAVPVTVEFLCPVGPGRRPGQLYNPRGQVGRSLSALAISQGAAVDADVQEREVVVDLPGGGRRARARLKVTGPAGFIAAKVDAIARRAKHKDAYDLIWLLRAWPDGAEALGAVVSRSPAMELTSMRHAIDQLAEQFADHNAVGSRYYASFVAIQATPDFDTPAREAVGAVRELLAAL